MQLPLLPYVLTVVPAFLSAVGKQHAFPTKQVIASAIYALVLAGLATTGSPLVTQFAWLVAIGSVLTNGITLITIMNRAVK